MFGYFQLEWDVHFLKHVVNSNIKSIYFSPYISPHFTPLPSTVAHQNIRSSIVLLHI